MDVAAQIVNFNNNKIRTTNHHRCGVQLIKNGGGSSFKLNDYQKMFVYDIYHDMLKAGSHKSISSEVQQKVNSRYAKHIRQLEQLGLITILDGAIPGVICKSYGLTAGGVTLAKRIKFGDVSHLLKKQQQAYNAWQASWLFKHNSTRLLTASELNSTRFIAERKGLQSIFSSKFVSILEEKYKSVFDKLSDEAIDFMRAKNMAYSVNRAIKHGTQIGFRIDVNGRNYNPFTNMSKETRSLVPGLISVDLKSSNYQMLIKLAVRSDTWTRAELTNWNHDDKLLLKKDLRKLKAEIMGAGFYHFMFQKIKSRFDNRCSELIQNLTLKEVKMLALKFLGYKRCHLFNNGDCLNLMNVFSSTFQQELPKLHQFILDFKFVDHSILPNLLMTNEQIIVNNVIEGLTTKLGHVPAVATVHDSFHFTDYTSLNKLTSVLNNLELVYTVQHNSTQHNSTDIGSGHGGGPEPLKEGKPVTYVNPTSGGSESNKNNTGQSVKKGDTWIMRNVRSDKRTTIIWPDTPEIRKPDYDLLDPMIKLLLSRAQIKSKNKGHLLTEEEHNILNWHNKK